MPSIKLTDSSSGQIFEASELLPLDIVEETNQMDSLNGSKAMLPDELISNRPSQEDLMVLCDELKNPDLPSETRESIKEVLSLYDFDCAK